VVSMMVSAWAIKLFSVSTGERSFDIAPHYDWRAKITTLDQRMIQTLPVAAMPPRPRRFLLLGAPAPDSPLP
jgi:hypothetical protein